MVADARRLPFVAETFDTVFSYSVLQHFSPENAVEAIKQAASVSKPDAHLKIQMANQFGIRCLYHQLRRGFRSPEGFEVRYYSPRMLKRLFESNYGPCRLSIDGFLGLGIQPSDKKFLSRNKRLIVEVSEVLRRFAKLLPPLCMVADSIYVDSRCQRMTVDAKNRPDLPIIAR